MPEIEELLSKAEASMRRVGVEPSISETHDGTGAYPSPSCLVAGRVPGKAAVFSARVSERFPNDPSFAITCELDLDSWNRIRHGDLHSGNFLPRLPRRMQGSESGFGKPPQFCVNHCPSGGDFAEGAGFYAAFLLAYGDILLPAFTETPHLFHLVPYHSPEYEAGKEQFVRSFTEDAARQLGI